MFLDSYFGENQLRKNKQTNKQKHKNMFLLQANNNDTRKKYRKYVNAFHILLTLNLYPCTILGGGLSWS